MRFLEKDCSTKGVECEGTEICRGIFRNGELEDVFCAPAADRNEEQSVKSF